jgi:hypothetical protein
VREVATRQIGSLIDTWMIGPILEEGDGIRHRVLAGHRRAIRATSRSELRVTDVLREWAARR